MTRSTRWTIILIPLLATAAACMDSIIKTLAPENNEQVSTTGGVFRYQSEELDNVHDRRTFTWANPGTQAIVHHHNFIHHGLVLITIRDALGALVDSVPAEWEIDDTTDAGAPGAWTVKFEYFNSRGRIDTSLEPLLP
jgi:hypothetical protein